MGSTVIAEKKMEDDVSTHVSDAVATEPAAEPAANADVSVGEMTRETDPIAAKTQAAEGVTDTTKIVLDDSDVVQVEEEEFEVTNVPLDAAAVPNKLMPIAVCCAGASRVTWNQM